jgi:hypothetical protein
MSPEIRQALQRGLVIPACPLALNASRKLDERRQRALLRYYAAAGAGGVAVGVHTTQFAIRDPAHGLFRPVVQLAAEELACLDAGRRVPLVRIGGICGGTTQARDEAALLRELGYHAGLLSLAAMRDAREEELITHCRAVADVLPVIGFYLQPAVGGRVLPFAFWRRFVEIDNVVAVKVAPFNRYQTLEVVRAVAEAGRDDIALYTGNDDQIVLDLLTPYRFNAAGRAVECRIVGGLLGHWAVWTQKAVELLEECHRVVQSGGPIPTELLRRANEVTAGLHEVLRRQALFEGLWCLDPCEGLSPGQREEINRVCAAYPHLNDDAFVAAHRDQWLLD